MLEKKCNLVIASFCQNMYEIRDRRASAIRVVNDSSWKLVTLDERIMANPRHMCCPAGSMVRGLVRRQQIDIRVFGNVCTSPRNVWTTLSADEELDCARSTGLRSQLGVRESVALGCATVISASKLVSWTLIYASTLHLPIHVLPWQLVNALISDRDMSHLHRVAVPPPMLLNRALSLVLSEINGNQRWTFHELSYISLPWILAVI